MSIVSNYFSAFLTSRLEATDVFLPMSTAATADLVGMLQAEGSYIYLTIRSDTRIETVRARRESDTILLDRGIEGTEPGLHHYGACVQSISPTVVAVIKDLVCNYTCCEDDVCPCEPAAFAGSVLPDGNVGREWNGTVIFTGTAPLVIGASDTPAWMTVTRKGNFLELSGSPTVAGVFQFSVAATNCSGTQVVTKPLTVTTAN